jgi:hypothetical protein
MTQDEIDTMWQKAMQESITDGEMFTRYHFAKLVAERALSEHAMQEVQRLGQEIEQEPVAKYCCRLCFNKSGSLLLDRMILCSECGNKRCPKATNHELQCTNSNAPNQAGSIYNTPPQRTEQEPDDIASIIACRDMLDAQPVPPRRTEGKT